MKLSNLHINTGKALKKVLIGYAVVIIVGIILTCIFGVNLDINFKGGTRISYTYSGELNTADAESVVNDTLGQKAAVTYGTSVGGDEQQMVISLSGNSSLSADTQNSLTKALQEKFDTNNFELYDSNSVSPTIAGAFFGKSLVAVLLAGIIVVVYIGVRFRNIGGVSAAVTAYIALILDCIVAFLACTAFRLPVDSNLIAVILTLLGYSLNDTIVIYDRVREEKRLNPQGQIADLVDNSINVVKTRTVITTLTTVAAVTTIIVVAEICGLSTLRSFAIPMAFGLVSGCISSLLVAGPLWVVWKNHVAKRPPKQKKKKK